MSYLSIRKKLPRFEAQEEPEPPQFEVTFDVAKGSKESLVRLDLSKAVY